MSSVPPSSDEISRGLKVKPFEGGTEGMVDSSLNEAPQCNHWPGQQNCEWCRMRDGQPGQG